MNTIAAALDEKRFKAWIATQHGPYDYANGFSCPIAKFLKDQRVSFYYVLSEHVISDSGPGGDRGRVKIPDDMAHVVVVRPHTYEALYERLS